jgi:HEAT repeat protein
VDERTQALLESDDVRDRIDGLREVALVEDEEAGPLALRRLDDDRSPEVREHAARAVGLALGGRAVGALEQAAASDDDPIVRRTALAVLGEIGERPACRALERLLFKVEARDRVFALDGLRAAGDRTSAAAAASLAADPSAPVVAVAVHTVAALGLEGAPEPSRSTVVAAARALLDAECPFVMVPAAAFVAGRDVSVEVATRGARVRSVERDRAALRAIELPREPARAALVALALLAQPARELGAARELARIGDRAGVPVLARAALDGGGKTAIDAAIALAELGLAIGEPLLLRSLERVGAAERPAVARALALMGRDEGVRALGALLASDVPSDRRAAALGFLRIGRRDGVRELVRALDFCFRREREEAHRALRPIFGEGAPALDTLATKEERAPVVAAFRAKLAPEA